MSGEQLCAVLLATQPQNPLNAQGADSILLAGHKPHCTKPQRQRKVAGLEYGSCRHRDLTPTLAAQPKPPGHRPCLPTAAARAYEAIRPTKLTQVSTTSFVRPEAGLELRQRAGIVLHGAAHYGLRQVESRGYPISHILPSSIGCIASGKLHEYINLSFCNHNIVVTRYSLAGVLTFCYAIVKKGKSTK